MSNIQFISLHTGQNVGEFSKTKCHYKRINYNCCVFHFLGHCYSFIAYNIYRITIIFKRIKNQKWSSPGYPARLLNLAGFLNLVAKDWFSFENSYWSSLPPFLIKIIFCKLNTYYFSIWTVTASSIIFLGLISSIYSIP